MADPRKKTIKPEDARRIVDSVKYVEKLYKNDPPARSRAVPSNNPGVKIAVTNETIQSGLSGTPGTGKVTLYRYDGPGHAPVSTGVIVTVSNIAAAIPASKQIYVSYGDGGWHVVVYPCTT